MGCCSSALANDSTLSGYYAAKSQQKRSSKRNFFTHSSSGSSSGVSSAHTSPARRSTLSRCNSTPSPLQKVTAAKTRQFAYTHKNVSTAFEMMSICDDFGEAAKLHQQPENKSFGYYSESIHTESNTSSPSQSCFRRTQDISIRLDSSSAAETPLPKGLEMEMYMVGQSQGLMMKTSSPIFQRKDVTFDAIAIASPPSHSYQKWASYLQSTPTYMVHNVTNIPEAIAGHFSPLNFPAFTDLEEMESAAKRFKVDTSSSYEPEIKELLYQHQIPKPVRLKHVITTDL